MSFDFVHFLMSIVKILVPSMVWYLAPVNINYDNCVVTEHRHGVPWEAVEIPFLEIIQFGHGQFMLDQEIVISTQTLAHIKLLVTSFGT